MKEQRTEAVEIALPALPGTRRKLLLALAGIGSGAMVGQPTARAAGWPERPINVLVGYSAGGSLDQMVRLVAEHVGGELGHKVLVDNRPGAAGTLAAAAVARASADGYTYQAAGDPELLLAPRTMRLP